MSLELGLPLSWVIAYGFIILISFTIASTLGMGGPLLVMPALLLQFEASTAVALIVPLIWSNNVGRAVLHRHHIHWEAVWRSGLLAIPCTLVFAFLTHTTPNLLLKGLIVALIIYALARRHLFNNQIKVSPRGLVWWGLPIGGFTGLMGTSGPPMAIAYRGFGLEMHSFVATFSTLQIVMQLVRLPGYWSSGLLHENNLMLSLFFALCGLPGIFIAKPLLRKINPKVFRVGIDLVLAGIALSLLTHMIASGN